LQVGNNSAHADASLVYPPVNTMLPPLAPVTPLARADEGAIQPTVSAVQQPLIETPVSAVRKFNCKV